MRESTRADSPLLWYLAAALMLLSAAAFEAASLLDARERALIHRQGCLRAPGPDPRWVNRGAMPGLWASGRQPGGTQRSRAWGLADAVGQRPRTRWRFGQIPQLVPVVAIGGRRHRATVDWRESEPTDH
jgi:hypothetical protein